LYAYNRKAKKFRYITKPLKATPTDLIGTDLLSSTAIHILATPEEVTEQVPQLLELRTQRGIKRAPLIIWEPFPAACTTQNRQAFMQACKLVDVFSPNHLEMTALFEETTTGSFHKDKLEEYAHDFSRTTGLRGSGTVIVRSGEHGSLTVQNMTTKLWLPPFYPIGASEVIDPTGAGNTFLGGFIAGWKSTGDLKVASAYGNVAASYAIEQIGLPSLSFDGKFGLCNGVRVIDRLSLYRRRIELL
jgi:sugar/nucleoside kinase (ribokinase family)